MTLVVGCVDPWTLPIATAAVVAVMTAYTGKNKCGMRTGKVIGRTETTGFSNVSMNQIKIAPTRRAMGPSC